MKTAISERERHSLDIRIQAWIAAEEVKEAAVQSVCEKLAIDPHTAVDLLNTCANSRAMLDALGVEVYGDYTPPQPPKFCADDLPDESYWDPFDAIAPWLPPFCLLLAGIIFLVGVAMWFA